MNALAASRRDVLRHQHKGDLADVNLCYKMLSTVAEEMRVRYVGERQKNVKQLSLTRVQRNGSVKLNFCAKGPS
jgi:hypothetical protein